MRTAGAICTLLAAALSVGAAARAQDAPATARTVPARATGTQVEGGGMPDLARGKLAMRNGDDAEAEANFLPLARHGYVEAQLALASLYARRHTPQSVQDAIHWYRTAAVKAPLQAEVPLARLLLQQDAPEQLGEADQLFTHAWDERQDPEALAGLIELYAGNPAYDTRKRMPMLVARAEQLDQPVTNGALIAWYRNTRDVPGHGERLLAMCRKSLALAPTCYADLLRDMRARNDKQGMQRMVAAAMSQLGQGLLPPETAASIVRALVETPDDADAEGAPVAVSDQPENDADEMAPAAATPPLGLTGAARTCAENPVDVAKVGGNDKTSQLPPTAINAQTDLAENVVARLADGSVDARVEAAGLVVRYPFLAPDFDAETALQAGQKAGLPDAVLYLGELYLKGDRATRDPRKAQDLLRRAARTPATALDAQYYLGRLYQFGYLDEVAPRQAVDHLLYAARRGYVSADGALARLYASGKGVCPNHVYAYVFAQLGGRNGGSSIRRLASQLNGALTAQQRQAAQSLLREEQAARRMLLPTQAGLAEAGPSNP
ncbi:hypothetical protein ACO2Q2_05195 [Dyella sp. KRB-257]|uniref:tetratricopeptide repeat protein n=1 Tax=Dyella sp. KRB-257 TaxID=3400915 RepID=UPI003C067192